MIRPSVLLACACLALGSLHLNGANLVANPGFETGDFTGWTLSGANSSPDDNGLYYGIDTVDAHSGNYGAYFGSLGGVRDLSQLIPTISGDTYTISFWLSETPGTIFPYTNSLSASFGSTTLISESDMSNFPYTLFTYDAKATSDLTLLEFGFRDDVGYFSFDDVSVVPAVINAPEPASFGLELLALIAWALWFQRAWRGRRSVMI
jgi:hypothetical protein